MRRLAICILVLGLAGLPATAHSGWSPLPQRITSSPLVASLGATTDGSGGVILVWQSADISGSAPGPLLAQHLLSTGDLDPAWPSSGLMLNATPAVRHDVRLWTDDRAGAYVSWFEANIFVLTHVDGHGAIVTGWPTGGMPVATLGSTDVCGLEDGTGGLYVAWASATARDIWLDHYVAGVNGASGTRTRVSLQATTGFMFAWAAGPRLALTGDGGLWAAWTRANVDTTGGVLFAGGGNQVVRLGPGGGVAPGWSVGGKTLDTLQTIRLATLQPPDLLAVAADAEGGVYVVSETISPISDSGFVRVRRLDPAGNSMPGWESSGRLVSGNAYYLSGSPTVDVPLAYGDHQGGLWALWPERYQGAFRPSGPSLPRSPGSTMTPPGTHFGVTMGPGGPPGLASDGRPPGSSRAREVPPPDRPSSENLYVFANAVHFSEDGRGLGWGIGGTYGDLQTTTGDGALYSTVLRKCGPYGYDVPPPELTFYVSDPPTVTGILYDEYYDPVGICRFGDAAVVYEPPLGVIFLYSKITDPTGIFARRFAGGGEVTGAPPVADVRGLGLSGAHFVPCIGFRAFVSLPQDERTKLEAFDLLGRRVASTPLSGAGVREVTLEATDGLASGLYLLRVSQGDRRATAKVLVIR